MRFTLLTLLYVNPFVCMENTPPNPLPKILREDSSHHDAMPVSVLKAKDDERRQNDVRRISREPAVVDMPAAYGQIEPVQKYYSTRYVVVSNCITGLLTALVGTGVALAVRFGDCKKD